MEGMFAIGLGYVAILLPAILLFTLPSSVQDTRALRSDLMH